MLYEIKLREGEEHFTTSLVKDAAVETTLMLFNKNEDKPLFFANEEKKVIYSVAMRPNKKIFRKDVNGVIGEDGYVFYTEETVEKFQQNYFKFGGKELTKINHEGENVKDVYLFESWIVKDPNNDKSNAIGLESFKGDLIQGFKFENDEFWQMAKEGKIDGLSIEAYFDNFEINKKDVKMSKQQNFWSVLKTAMKKFAEDNETLSIAIDGNNYSVTALELGGLVTTESGEPLADGVFEVDGKTYKTDTLGLIVDIADVVVEEMADEEVDAKEEEKVEVLETENEDLKEEIQDLKAEIVEVKEELEKMKRQTPKAKVISRIPNVYQKDFKDMTPLERFRASKNN